MLLKNLTSSLGIYHSRPVLPEIICLQILLQHKISWIRIKNIPNYNYSYRRLKMSQLKLGISLLSTCFQGISSVQPFVSKFFPVTVNSSFSIINVTVSSSYLQSGLIFFWEKMFEIFFSKYRTTSKFCCSNYVWFFWNISSLTPEI